MLTPAVAGRVTPPPAGDRGLYDAHSERDQKMTAPLDEMPAEPAAEPPPVVQAMRWGAEQLLQAETVARNEALPGQCDQRLRGRPGLDAAHLVGCGIYYITYRHRPIYLGKFLGRAGDARGGNVIQARWHRHLGTLTLRAHRLSISRQAFARLLERLPADHPLARALAQCDVAYVSRDRGYLVPFNRALFAAAHWTAFLQPVDTWLADFRIGYVRFSSAVVAASAQLRHAVSEAEQLLIAQLRLPCNAGSDYHRAMAEPVLGVDELEARIGAQLNVALEAVHGVGGLDAPQASRRPRAVRRVERVDPEGEAAERFDEQLPDGWPRELVDRLKDEERTGWTPHVREDDWLAIKAGAGNALVLKWQPSRERFLAHLWMQPEDLAARLRGADGREAFGEPRRFNANQSECSFDAAQAGAQQAAAIQLLLDLTAVAADNRMAHARRRAAR